MEIKSLLEVLIDFSDYPEKYKLKVQNVQLMQLIRNGMYHRISFSLPTPYPFLPFPQVLLSPPPAPGLPLLPSSLLFPLLSSPLFLSCDYILIKSIKRNLELTRSDLCILQMSETMLREVEQLIHHPRYPSTVIPTVPEKSLAVFQSDPSRMYVENATEKGRTDYMCSAPFLCRLALK